MTHYIKLLYVALSSFFLYACGTTEQQLPIMGHKEAIERTINGKVVNDTLYYTLPDFSFVDQDNKVVTEATFKNKIYVADFFFTTCPTICPIMKSNLLKVYEKYYNNNDLLILSHTIDPVHDSVAVLKDYADRLEVKSSKWHFVTGQKDSIYAMGKSYLVSAVEDKDAPGGFIHSGALILVDKQRRIRGYYDGTEEEKVNKLIEDIALLLNEK